MHWSSCFLRLFERYPTDDTYIIATDDPIKGFFVSAKAGTLPSVLFIDPSFIDEPDGQDNADGPPADIAAGQNLIGKGVDTMVHSLNHERQSAEYGRTHGRRERSLDDTTVNRAARPAEHSGTAQAFTERRSRQAKTPGARQ